MKKTIAILALLSSLALVQAQDLSIALYPDLDSHLENVIGEFEQQHGVDVEIRVLQHGDHHNALVTQLATGSGAADVVAIDVGFIARFVAEGGLTDLSQEPFNAGRYQDLFAPYAWLQGSTTDGRIVAMPTDLGPGVMYYRRDRFEEVGADVDDVIESWDSYIEFGEQVTRDTDGDGQNDVFLIADAGDVARAIMRSGLGEGEGVFFDADGEVLVDSDRFHRAFEVAKRIRDAGLDAQIGAWTNEWYEAFQQGTVATQMSGAWLLGHLQNWMAPETAGLWGASHLPNGIYGFWGGSFYGIPDQSENKELAWELIQYLTTNPEVQLAAFERIGAFPAVTSTYDDPMFQEPLAFLDGQPARELFAEIARNIEGVATHPSDMIATEIVDSALTSVLNGESSIDEALAEAQRLIARRVR
ncbi:MAG TPA: extracellular solute-binding protein [Trueperaceae bacterium]